MECQPAILYRPALVAHRSPEPGMSAMRSTGVVPTHTGHEDSRAAYTVTGLHTATPRVVSQGRYETAPFKPYVYGGSRLAPLAGFQKRV